MHRTFYKTNEWVKVLQNTKKIFSKSQLFSFQWKPTTLKETIHSSKKIFNKAQETQVKHIYDGYIRIYWISSLLSMLLVTLKNANEKILKLQTIKLLKTFYKNFKIL